MSSSARFAIWNPGRFASKKPRASLVRQQSPGFAKPTLILLVSAIIAATTGPISATAQAIPAKGSAGTFEVASWNVEFFGGGGGPSDDDQQIANVKEVILASNVDLWAFQEIADEADFNSMVADLGAEFGSVIAPTSTSQGLGLAYVYRKDTIRLRNAKEILEQFSTGSGNPFAGRPPFQLEADITLPDTTVTVTLINLHMKAQSDLDSYNRRAAASTRLKNNIDFTLLASQPVIVLGDFNDLLLGSITFRQESPYKNFVDDIGNYATPTLQMQLDDRSTFCGNSSSCNGSTIDHIVISNEVEPWYVDGSADHYDELLTAITAYVFTTSDHLPVFAAFDVARGVEVTDVPGAKGQREVVGVNAHPNPFVDKVTIEVSVRNPGPVLLEMFDLIGRRVAVRSLYLGRSGYHSIEMATGDIPRGTYVLAATTSGSKSSRLLVKR